MLNCIPSENSIQRSSNDLYYLFEVSNDFLNFWNFYLESFVLSLVYSHFCMIGFIAGFPLLSFRPEMGKPIPRPRKFSGKPPMSPTNCELSSS